VTSQTHFKLHNEGNIAQKASDHRLRIQILLILKVPKIREFLRIFETVNFKIHKIQIITFIAEKF